MMGGQVTHDDPLVSERPVRGQPRTFVLGEGGVGEGARGLRRVTEMGVRTEGGGAQVTNGRGVRAGGGVSISLYRWVRRMPSRCHPAISCDGIFESRNNCDAFEPVLQSVITSQDVQ